MSEATEIIKHWLRDKQSVEQIWPLICGFMALSWIFWVKYKIFGSPRWIKNRSERKTCRPHCPGAYPSTVLPKFEVDAWTLIQSAVAMKTNESMPRFQPASIAAFIWPAWDCVAEKENPAGRRFLLKSYLLRKWKPLESDERQKATPVDLILADWIKTLDRPFIVSARIFTSCSSESCVHA